MTCRFQAVGSAIWRSEGTRIEGRIMAGGDPAAPPANVLALVRGPPHGRPPRGRSLECPGPREDWSTAVQRPSPGPWTTDSYVESLLAGTQVTVYSLDTLQDGARLGFNDRLHHHFSLAVHHRDYNRFLVNVHANIFNVH